MSRETSRGQASVRQLCGAMCLSTQAFYKALKRLSCSASDSKPARRKPQPNMTVSDARLREEILRVKDQDAAEFWGHRKVWAILRHQQGLVAGHNRVWKMMGALGLLLPATGPHSLHARTWTGAVTESNRPVGHGPDHGVDASGRRGSRGAGDRPR